MKRFAPYVFLSELATRWDVLAFVVVIGLIAFLGETSRACSPVVAAQRESAVARSGSSARVCGSTTFRMLAGLVLSLIFTLTYATWAAKSERAGNFCAPSRHPAVGADFRFHFGYRGVFLVAGAGTGSRRGIRVHFAIFTSQAWNMRSVSTNRCGHTDRTHRSRRVVSVVALDALLAIGSAVWHAGAHLEHDDVHVGRLVLRGGSESITVGHTTVALPGVGSYIALAIAQKNLQAIGWAICTMLIVILMYDQLLFRPLVAWWTAFAWNRSRASACRTPGHHHDAPVAADQGRHGRVHAAFYGPAERWSAGTRRCLRRRRSRSEAWICFGCR